MSPAGFAARHRAAVLLGVAFMVAAGLWALRSLPAGAYPEVTFPRIVVLAQAGTLEPRDMVVAVTRPLEEALNGVIDLRHMRSRTVRGVAEVSLDFRPGADMNVALQQVQSRTAAITGDLPPELSLRVERLTPSVFPIFQFELTGGDPVALRDLAQYLLRPRFARLPDVGAVDVQGGLVREVAVVLDPARLVTNGVSAAEVADRIREGNVVDAVGRLDREYRQLSVIATGLAATPEAIGDIVVRRRGESVLRVRDLATVGYGAEDLFQLARGNGVPAALINVSRQPAGNTLRLEAAVLATADSLRAELPSGVKLDLVYDQASLVRTSIGSVRDAMLIGGFLAVIVLLIFLQHLRITLIAALTVPLTLIGTFVGLLVAGDSLNLMSLGGMAVAVGLVIDDAIVVVENLERRLRSAGGGDRSRVIQEATDEILGPVAGSTVTTVVVFAPLAFLGGVLGQFFRSFALALGIAVLLSLVLAVFLVPVLAGRLLGPTPERSAGDAHGPAWFAPVLRGYRSVAGRLLRGRWLVPALAAAALTAVGVAGAGRVGTGFLPSMDEGGFVLDYWTPTGTSLAETDRQVRSIEAILQADPAVQSFTRRTGSELGFFATGPSRGDMTVLLRPLADRSASVFDVINRVRAAIQERVPAVRVEFPLILQDLLGDLAGSTSPVEVRVFHPDLRVAEAAARRIADRVASVPGLEDLFDGVQGDVPSLQVAWDPVRLARLGVSPAEATRQLHGALFGAGAGVVREADRLVPIRVRLPDSVRLVQSGVEGLPIVGAETWAPLASLARVSDSADISELTRDNLRPMVAVTASVNPAASSLGAVMREVRARVGRLVLPPGVRYEFGGQYASQQESFGQLVLVLGFGAVTVLLVMVLQFGTLRGPVAILVAALLGMTGAVVALLATGVPFNVSSFMGLILLVGLVVKNGIILLDAATRFHREGQSPRDALLAAGALRLRPILMTTVCTIAGLLPLALGIGAGAEMQQPLAIVVIGGLTLSTAVTLLLLPAVLAMTGSVRHRPGHARASAGEPAPRAPAPRPA